MRPKRDPTPPARLRFQPILWVTWAVLCVAALGVAGFFATDVVKVPQTQTFVGTLKPNQSPTELKLPAGVPFKSMLVQTGEEVRAGQTVAVLDQVALQAELDHIERSIAAAYVLRACLLPDNGASEEVNDGSVALRTDQADDAELQVLIKTARADCAAGARENQQKRARLERGLEILQERLILVNQKLVLVLGVHSDTDKKEVHPVLRAHASVSVALERNDLLQKLQVLKAELDGLRVAQDQVRLARVAALSKDVARDLKHQAVLRTFLENPRLNVPEKGRIGRVRPVPAGTRFDEDQTILEVHGDAEAQFIASLRVPLDQAAHLPLGTSVEVSLAGFTKRGPKLSGVVEQWVEGSSETGADYATARIRLEDESQMALANPQNGVALRGASTASVIRAQLEPETLKSTLQKAIGQNGPWAFWSFGGATQIAEATPHPM